MFDTVKLVGEETVTKESNIMLTRKPTDSFLSGNVDDSY